MADPVDRIDLGAIAGGDADAMSRLYSRYAARLLGYARSIVGPDLADEVVQDAFVAVWRKAHTFEGRSEASTWLYTVTRNCAFNQLRRKRPTPIDPHSAAEIQDTHARLDSTTEAAVLARHSLDELATALDRLPRRHREILVLCFVDDLSYGEVASILDIPSGTVKSRVFTARNALAALLDSERGDNRTNDGQGVSEPGNQAE